MGTLAGLADFLQSAQQWKKPRRSGAGSVLALNEEVPQLEIGLQQPMQGKGGSVPVVRLSPPGGPWKLTLKGGMATMAGIGLTDQSFSFHF